MNIFPYVHHVVTQSPSSTAPSWLNVGAITGLAVFLASLLALWLGVSQMAKSGKGQVKEAAKQSGVAVIGLVWIAIGVGGSALAIAIATLAFFVKK